MINLYRNDISKIFYITRYILDWCKQTNINQRGALILDVKKVVSFFFFFGR